MWNATPGFSLVIDGRCVAVVVPMAGGWKVVHVKTVPLTEELGTFPSPQAAMDYAEADAVKRRA